MLSFVAVITIFKIYSQDDPQRNGADQRRCGYFGYRWIFPGIPQHRTVPEKSSGE